MTASVLLVEDDDAVRSSVARGLTLNGLDVREAVDAEQALELLAAKPADLLVIDVGLPGLSGIELCAELRERRVDVPILILSARDAVGDRVEGLRSGADDYLVKPFELEELVARLQALLRRAPPVTTRDIVTAGPIWIDIEARVAKVETQRLELSRREFDLLAALVANRDIVLSRVRLLEVVWGYDFDLDTNVVDVFVGYLRRKLSALGAVDVIETVRGVGFVIRTAERTG